MLKVSFIIPAYNVEKYLAKCLDSLLAQPVREFEIVLIDDGSSDGTGEIASRYAAQYPCIKAFHQTNAGQGAARNFGISKAEGEYIWFIDADDWVEENVLPRLYNLLSHYAPDVLFCNYIMAYEDGRTQLNLIPPAIAGRLCQPDTLSENDFAALTCWCGNPVRLIARREFLLTHAIRFATGLFYEDHPFAMQVARHARSFFIDAPPSYVYYQRPGSTVRRQDRRVFDFIAVRAACLKLFQEYGWKERYPNLYASYLLPGEFIAAHVPDSLHKEFLNALQTDIHDEDLAHIAGVLKNNLRARGCLMAIRQSSMRPYRIFVRAEKIKNAFTHARVRSRAYRLLKMPFSFLRKVKRHLIRLLRGDSDNALWYRAHPTVKTNNIRIEIRRNPENRPYVYADEDANLACHCVFETGQGSVHFGRRCSVGHGTVIICTQKQGIHIGNSAMVSWGCTIVDNNSHRLDPELRHNDAWHWKLGEDYKQLGTYKDWTGIKQAPVSIEDGAWIGFGSVILPGVTVGRGSVVGAQSVVSRSIPPFTVFAGNPARFIGLPPRQCGWTWQELIAALRAAPEHTATERTPEEYLAAALRFSREELVIRDLPPPGGKSGTSGQPLPEQAADYWVRAARAAGAGVAEWKEENGPALMLSNASQGDAR